MKSSNHWLLFFNKKSLYVWFRNPFFVQYLLCFILEYWILCNYDLSYSLCNTFTCTSSSLIWQIHKNSKKNSWLKSTLTILLYLFNKKIKKKNDKKCDKYCICLFKIYDMNLFIYLLGFCLLEIFYFGENSLLARKWLIFFIHWMWNSLQVENISTVILLFM